MVGVAYGFPSYTSKRHRFGVTVELYRHVPGAVVDGYAEEDTYSGPVLVHGSALAPGDMVEPFEANREGSEVAYTWYAPPDVAVGPKDRAVIPGESDPFDIVGPVKNWGRNPFTGGESGVVVRLGRFDG